MIRKLSDFSLILIFLFLAANLSAQEKRVNINTATKEELIWLKGIGEKRSAKIIQSRERDGKFKRIEELTERKLIPKSVFNNVKKLLAVKGKTEIKSPPTFKEILKNNLFQGKFWILYDSDFYEVLLNKIRTAKKSIVLSTFVFKASSNPKNRATIVRNELKKAAKKGISVYVIAEHNPKNPGLDEINQKTLRSLKLANVKVRKDSPKRTLHSKLVVIDRRFSFIGSHNITDSALARNSEVSIMVDSKPLAGKIESYIRDL